VAPEDSESRTFLHDIPVIGEFRAEPVIAALKRRKNVLIPGRGVVTFGVVSPEQAFVHFSSVCFALFVKFCGDHLAARRRGESDGEEEEIMAGLVAYYEALLARARDYPAPPAGPYRDREETLAAITAAGKATVECGMVDSFFGNVSYLLDDTIHITQTTSSLDELAGCIDACPLDGSSCVGITASSEYTAHREVLENSSRRAILHGHPRFAVIHSMICDIPDCPGRGNCHRVCHRERRAGAIPIAPGEPGTGRYGLATTLPPRLKEHPGVIIYGHGLFTASDTGLDEAFRTLVETEAWCFRDYLRLVGW
jgi:ribulose-5-phosphate 4-epimerase/fuculose-1-phosphate aldolase